MAGFNIGRVVDAGTTFNPYNRYKKIESDVRNTINPRDPVITPAPGAPTVDQALIDREAGDTIRRRRSRSQSTIAGDSSVPTNSLLVQSLLGG